MKIKCSAIAKKKKPKPNQPTYPIDQQKSNKT